MAEAPNLVLHLGAHKTGTSLLQRYMKSRPEELAGMRAVALSRDQLSATISWGTIPQEHPERLREAVLAASRARLVVPERSRAHRLRRRLGRGPASVKTVIVSIENALGRPFGGSGSLYPAAAASAQGLRRSVGEFAPRIVYYIRSQEEFVESYYLQTVHQGGTASFDQWLSTIDTTAISWVPVIEALADAFGPSHVVVRDFTEIRQGQNAFITNFLRLCDPDLHPSVDYRRPHNLSISQQGLDLALAMNPLLIRADDRHATRKFLQAHFNNTTGPRPALLSEDAKSAIRERYGSQNRDLLARFAGPGSPST
ncbi:MAG: hypothetical protein WCF36_02910 [Candidatus Nanopelagicales bacterium]